MSLFIIVFVGLLLFGNRLNRALEPRREPEDDEPLCFPDGEPIDLSVFDRHE